MMSLSTVMPTIAANGANASNASNATNAAIPATARPWLQQVYEGLDLTLDFPPDGAPPGFMLADVPILWSRTLTGDEHQLIAQAVVTQIGPQAKSGPLLEAVLQSQLLLAGPGMPVFGLDIDSRSLVLIRAFSVDVDAPAHAIELLHALARTAMDSRAALQGH